MKKFAFILMGDHYNPDEHQVRFETKHQMTGIYTVQNVEQARQTVQELVAEGYGAIELCGAFGPELAEELADLTGGKAAIGYVTHSPGQDQLMDEFFENFGKP